MKYILFLALCFLAFNVKAQKIDTVKAAIQIQPVVTNAFTKDTAFQLMWQANSLTRDTSAPVAFYVAMFDRHAKKVLEFNLSIPAAIIAQWGTSDTIIDDYILNKYGLKKK